MKNPNHPPKVLIWAIIALIGIAICNVANAQTIIPNGLWSSTTYKTEEPDTVRMILIFINTDSLQMHNLVGSGFIGKNLQWMNGYEIKTRSGGVLYMDDRKRLLPNNLQVFMSVKPKAK